MSVKESMSAEKAPTTRQRIDQTLAGLETNWLNKFGYIPLGVSVISGKVRILYAATILVAAVAAAAIQSLKGSVTTLEKDEMTGSEILKKYAFQALGNTGRGMVEIIVPSISFTGGLYIFMYDKFPTDIHKTEKKEQPSIKFHMPFKIPLVKRDVKLTFRQGLRMAYEHEEFEGRRINQFVEHKVLASLRKRLPTTFLVKEAVEKDS